MPDYLDFDFDATQRDAWGQFTERLDMVLSVMDATEDLNISVAGAPEPRPGLHYSVDQPKVVTASFAGSNAGVATAQEALGLRELGWGDPVGGEYQVAMAQESSKQLARLSSQTLSEVLGVLHPVFLEPDQLVEILQGGEPVAEMPKEVRREIKAVMPANRAELDAIVDSVVRDASGHPALRNEQGDVAIRVGSTMVFLRTTPDAEELILFSILVHDVSGRSRACEVLNDLNVESRYGRFALHRDRVFVQLSVSARPLVPWHLRRAFSIIASIADGIDDELATKLGGRTTFGTLG